MQPTLWHGIAHTHPGLSKRGCAWLGACAAHAGSASLWLVLCLGSTPISCGIHGSSLCSLWLVDCRQYVPCDCFGVCMAASCHEQSGQSGRQTREEECVQQFGSVNVRWLWTGGLQAGICMREEVFLGG